MILCLAIGIALVRYVKYHAQYFPDHNSWVSYVPRSHKLQKNLFGSQLILNYESNFETWYKLALSLPARRLFLATLYTLSIEVIVSYKFNNTGIILFSLVAIFYF